MRRASLVLAGWSTFVWVTRVKNADGDVGVIIYSAGFVALSVLVGYLVLRRAPIAGITARLLAGLTIALWPVWLFRILADDHPAGFKIVHSVIGALSIGVSAWTWREVDVERKREAATTTAGLQELADR